ncbi:MAG: peptide ABC transporter substrate-binding protein [bacterium]|nr:peptide ABC transporter substrate-binding protein [bacterium]
MNEKPHIFSRRFQLPIFRTVDTTIRSLSLTGKVVFYTLATLFIISALGMLWQVNSAFLVEVPREGGALTEGVIGSPRFVNPVLSVTEGDKDISALVYSGLMRLMPNGTLGNDLADKHTVSPDGKIYTFTIRPNAVFHDGTPVTADDVVFTVRKIQDKAVKSNKQAQWEGILVDKTVDNEVRFTLPQAYAPFLENTTIGILPKHLWEPLLGDQFMNSNLNIRPIGSGPFIVETVDTNESGSPVMYTLAPFEKYYFGKPYIEQIIFKFFTTEKSLIEAYQAGEINAMNGISSENAIVLKQTGAPMLQSALPRIFAVFFNQTTNKVLAYKEVRQALSLGLNRQTVVDNVLDGFGSPLDSAVPKSFTNEVQSEFTDSQALQASSDHASSTLAAINLLEQNGWQLNANGIREKKVGNDSIVLSFSISTSDAPELKEVAELVIAEWKKLGADVSVKVVEGGYLNQNIIKPRRYDALLFGQVVNRDLDLYAFWHSSQRADPGLNVALYENKTVDTILEQMRVEISFNKRRELYQKFETELSKDVPAVFIYSPRFIYVVPQALHREEIHEVSTPSERFSTVSSWYLRTDKVWKIFAK